MKLRKLFYLILMITLFYSFRCSALEGIVNITNNVRIRTGPGTSHDILGNTTLPNVHTILNENKIATDDGTTDDCSYWYNISYNGSSAYICSEFLTVAVSSGTEGGSGDFESDLEKFPSSYRSALRELHKLYPSASFSALNTGLDFQTVVNNENYIANGSKIQARSLIEYPSDGYKSTNSIVYNWGTNTWNTNISGGGTNRWFAAHEDVIAYYLDPRNFLTYNSVFMFLNHGYSNNINYTEDAINEILSGSFMNGVCNDGVHTFARAFLDAGRESGVSPYYLAARVIQEIGRGNRSSFVDGKYNGYYNYYNIDATGSSNLVNALNRAKNEGWDNDYKAIIGGAKFIGNGYLNTGQSTLYLEKWDVVNGGNGYYSHQYMQNIKAPVSEANTLYNTYRSKGLTNTSMEFLIPVYNGMTTSTSMPNAGNPNNYLKNITINGYGISDFNMNKTEYTYNVSSVVGSVEVGVSMVANTSSVSGTGSVTIDGNKKHTISVAAGNGKVRNYVINFTKDDSKPVSVSDIVSSKGYVSDGKYISGINIGTSVDSIVNTLKINDNISVSVKSGDSDKSGVLVTGDKIIISSGDETKTYEVVIYGDLNGDGKVSALDYVSIKNSIMGTKNLSYIQKISGDVNRDGKISALDYVKVKNHIMGTGSIAQ